MTPQIYNLPTAYRGDTYPTKPMVFATGVKVTSITTGNEYVITKYNCKDDFTNIGLSENTKGIRWIATGDDPIWSRSEVYELTRVDLTGATIKAVFVKNTNGPSETSEIENTCVITDAAQGEFDMEFGIIDVTPTTYKYDIQVSYPNGYELTHLSGKLPVLDHVTIPTT